MPHCATLKTEIITLGRIAVRRDGEEIDELLRQPLRLALLIHLAVEREVGRDALQRMFWPRRRADRARHSLNQLLYQLRSVLGRDAVGTHGEFVRVSDSIIPDCTPFERALADDGDVAESALHRYGGPFLNGFPPPTAPFAAWVDERRRHYAQLNRAARRQLAGEMVATGDRSAAIAAARAWAATDPTDPEPGELVAKLLGSENASRPAAVGRAPHAVPRSGRRHRGVVMAAIMAGVFLSLTALGIFVVRQPPAPAPGAGEALVVAVVPFVGEPAPPDPAAPHRSLLDATAWLPGVHGIEAGSIPSPRSGWEKRRADGTLAAARARGITYLVTGEVAEPGNGPALTMEAWHVPSGERILRTSTFPGEVPGDALARLAFDMVTAVADRENLSLGLPEAVLADTRSPVALGHFMRGRHLMSRGQLPGARDAFVHASSADPDFGYARIRAAMAEAWDGVTTAGTPDARRPDDLQRRILDGLRLHALHRSAGAVAAFREALSLDPSSPDALAGLALALDAQVPTAGITYDDIAAAYHRLLTADSLYAPAHARLFELAILAGDSAAAARALASLEPGVADRQTGPGPLRRFVFDMMHGGRTRRAAALDSMRWLDGDAVTDAFDLIIRAPGGLPIADSLGAILQQPIRTPSERARGGDLRLVALAAMGHWGEAVGAWIRTAPPDRTSPYLVAAHLAGWPAAELAAESYARAERDADSGSPLVADAARRLLAHYASVHGDSARVHAALESLPPPNVDTIMVADSEDRGLHAALQARLHVLAADTTSGLVALETALASTTRSGSTRPLACLAPQRLIAVRLYVARGDTIAAARAARSIRHSICPASRLFTPAAAAFLGS